MSSKPALQVDGLGKRYRIGAQRERYKTFRDAITRLVKNPFRTRQASTELFWALKDVSFEITQGEVVGIIGRNGAGKSTLLKILSNITDPTEGVAKIYGTLGALLEVGTGFHPELTGRENIFLNGAILGMPRSEIARRFDEIVAFAEIERFLDTPSKHYSSGMYMRLAFSVAAHMDPEILLVDEVLAVGDANCQKKCLGKMEQVGKEGRTVLFVSHSMPTVLRLCRRAILLENGRYSKTGTPQEVVSAYLAAGTGASGHRVWHDQKTAPGDHVAKLHAVRVRDESGEVVDSIDIRRRVCIEVDYWILDDSIATSANLHFYNDEGTCLFVSADFNAPTRNTLKRRRGLVRSRCWVPGNFFAEGRVIVRYAAVSSYNPTLVHALERDAVSFQIVDKSEGDGVRGPYANEWPGVLRPMLDWQLEDAIDAEVLP
jgi:lipopolysaccharide transport system ATP-binding protein